MRRVFIDMDGVIVDFDGYKSAKGLTADEVKRYPGAYLDMLPIPGAIEAVRQVIAMGFEVFIATKPPTGVSGPYGDKAAWIFRHIPELTRHLIITPDKGLLGNEDDFLCDDRPHKANCENFAGTLLRFTDGFHWPQALDVLKHINPNKTAPRQSDYNAIEPVLTFDSEIHPLRRKQFNWVKHAPSCETATFAGEEMMVCVNGDNKTYQLTYLSQAHPTQFDSIDDAKAASFDFAKAVLQSMIAMVAMGPE